MTVSITPSQVSNPSFEEPGGATDQAFGWTTTTIGTFEELAWFSFEPGTEDDGTIEGFEDWTPGALFAFPVVTALPILYQVVFNATSLMASATETFEAFWDDNHHAAFSFLNVSLDDADFGAGLEAEDGFENGWDNDAYVTALTSVTSADFGGGTVDDFEAGWQNDTFITAFTAFILSVAEFGTAIPVEQFEVDWPDQLDGL